MNLWQSTAAAASHHGIGKLALVNHVLYPQLELHTLLGSILATVQGLIVTLKPDILIIPIPLSHGSPQFPHPHDIESPEEWVKGRVGNGPDHPDVVILLIHNQQSCPHPTHYHMQQEYQRGEG